MDCNELLKFSIHDEVWLMNNNKPFKSRIESIIISSKFINGITVSYRLHSSANLYNDEDLFKTKQGLIEHISNV